MKKIDWTNVVTWILMPMLAGVFYGAIIMMVVGRCGKEPMQTVVRDTVTVMDVTRDTVVVEIHDTLPIVKRERVVGYVDAESVQVCTAPDRDSLTVVQREYSDDSTYTAWVSGVMVGEWPKLDSISVRRREVTTTVKETVTIVEKHKARRLSVGVVGGYGYGMRYGGFEPFVGVGVSYRLWPP